MIRTLVTYLLFAGSLGFAGDAPKELRAYFEKTCDSKKFMGAVVIALNGKTVYAGACGWADAEWNVENKVDTRFRTGSIAKQFTAASVLLLHERRKFELTDPIGEFLPDLPETWRSATIHQLLTHTSGIPTYTQGPLFERLSRTGATPSEMLDLVRDKPLDFPHGAQFRYDNSGYILLGMLIEKVARVPYTRFVQESIFDRLGMRDTGFDEQHRVISHRARG